MTRCLAALACLILSFAANAQDRQTLPRLLSFEAPDALSPNGGWMGTAQAVSLDHNVVHGGKSSACVERKADTPNAFSGISLVIPVDFEGSRIELRGFLRTADVSDFVALWMREDGENPQAGGIEFATLQGQHIGGTADWKQYSISLPVNPQARRLNFGFLLHGTGKGWVDDLELLVDGKAIWDVPKTESAQTGIDRDHEFDGGSRIAVADLSPAQIRNLALLGRVWGFLKYHHPDVTAGKRNWDYDLFRVLPAVLEARDSASARQAVSKWIDALGPIAECRTCASLSEKELHLQPDLQWIEAEEKAGELGRMLRAIYRSRPAGGRQFYVSLAPGVGNPVLQNESAYSGLQLPDAGFQLLGLLRLWNIVEYWYPYRDLVGDWNLVLSESIPRVMLAKTPDAYKREMLAVIARIHDTHANLWSSLDVRPPVGRCQIPVIARFVENRAVVSGYSDDSAGPATGLKPGDAIEAIGGVSLPDLLQQWRPFYAASNDPTVLRDVARNALRGDCGEAKLRIRRDNESIDVTTRRIEGVKPNAPGSSTHDLPGPTFRRLSDEVAYLKLSSVKIADAAKYVDSAAGTKGLVIDIRNYPSEFVVFALGTLLVEKTTPFVRFTTGDLSNPGAFHFGPPLTLEPAQPHYAGKVVILVDEVSQSQAEYTTMAFRVAPHAVVIGSTTAGADGNVSNIPLPCDLRTMISGIGVFYPDKRPTQRLGILPDREVKPTIAGIQAGRDEVLESAIREILGADAPADKIEKLARGKN